MEGILLLAADRIAVVDNDEAFLRLMSLFLKLEGCDVRSYSYGRALAPELVTEHPDVIMFDTWIEDREAGWALLKALIDEPRLCGVPVILACSDPVELRSRRALLALYPRLKVLEKPFALDALLAVLEELRQTGGSVGGGVGVRLGGAT